MIASAVAVFAALPGDVVAQMAIPGKFEVSPVGAATYTIPIQVPPGVAGMEPKLALTYNSRGGNGQLGIGWTLDGLPSITRCARTTPQDGVKGAVAYDANDRFCLDGKRLMVVAGTYGAPGSSYRTEIDSLAKVTTFGSAGSGPLYFVVKTKDGQTMEFGNSVDSRVTVAGISTVRVWAINKIADAVGNTQSITYALPTPIATSTTEYNTYPQRIDYTSNSITGLPATNRIEFSYAARTDIISGYRGGYPVKTSVLLNGITTKTNGSVVSIYTPTYVTGTGGRSTITSISLCAAGGQLCTALTQFGIGGVTGSQFQQPVGVILPITTQESSVTGGKWVSLDVNGDGKTDLIHFTELSGIYRVWISNGDGSFTIQEFTANGDTSLSTGLWNVIDIDGDGRPDVVHMTTTPGLMRVWKSNGNGTFAISDFSGALSGVTLTDGVWCVIDVNGDGRADLMHMTANGGQARVLISNGDGTFAISSFTNTVDHEVYNEGFFRNGWQVLDVNGDGLADIVHLYRLPNSMPDGAQGGSWISVWTSNGDGTFRIAKQRDWKLMDHATVIQIDVNGDGHNDFVLMQSAQIPTAQGSHAMVLMSKGNGTFDVEIPVGGMWQQAVPQSLPDDPVQWGTWHVADANGDGLSDMIHTPTGVSTGQYWVYHSKGDGTFAISQLGGGGSVPVDSCTSFCLKMPDGDFLGIGSPGFVHLNEASTTVSSAWYLSSQPKNIVTSVDNGVGGITSWSLSPLPAMLSRGSYIKDIPSDTNIWTLSSAIPVVETVNNSIVKWEREGTIASLDRETSFTYGSARVERNGHGFLGFSWLQSKDEVTGLSTRTYFRQDFPYIGLAATNGTGSGGSWNNLNLTNTIYGCTLLDGGSTCSVAAGNRYFIYPSEVNSRSWDLDGTPLPGAVSLNSNPDRFGNLLNREFYILNPDGQPNADYAKRITNTYYNDEANWIIGRLVKSAVEATGPTVAAPVIPGSGGLPPAAAPTLPPQTTAALMAILQLLLGDD